MNLIQIPCAEHKNTKLILQMFFFFRKSMDHGSGLADSAPGSDDNIAFFDRRRCQRLVLNGAHHAHPVPPPCSPNSWIPRSRGHLVAMFTRIYQLRPSLVCLLSALSRRLLEHQQRLQFLVFAATAGQQLSKPVGLGGHLHHVQSANAWTSKCATQIWAFSTEQVYLHAALLP